ncbi:MAG: preprotein translocase subunit SecE [Chloroflexi bacterium]|nr:preprotein translocase subunit SecE [Chloroflexota bacterium]|tara:strand:- start:2497 stop:2730 length:234 start_codon:yes stop_codon:yes gene_type:complete
MARKSIPVNKSVKLSNRFSIIRFFSEVIGELRKVTWPSRQEATRLTILVLTLSITIGILLGIVDYFFSRLMALLSGT